MIHPTEYFEGIKESVMLRSMDGKIRFWNRSAEDLYGWSKADAIGKVSHELLQTQFPKPLEEIEAELIIKGRWQGRLVHATRDGQRVIVESRWSSDPTRQPPAIIEVNSRLTDDLAEDQSQGAGINGAEKPEEKVAIANNRMSDKKEDVTPSRGFRKTLQMTIVALLCCVAIVWIVYGFFGRPGIRVLHASGSSEIADRLLAGRAFTPLENYYWQAEQLLWSGTLTILAIAAVGWLLIRSVGGTILAAISLFLCSIFLFSALEAFPPLIKTIHVDAISPYFAYRANHVEDDVLIFRERPFNEGFVDNFKGSNYSPIFGVEVTPWSVEWKADANGFRNAGAVESADIVVLGDSYMVYGSTVDETFPSLLQERLPGMTIVNLGKAGYGPPQYLEVFKRFGLEYTPRYALFAFYEGNDMLDIRNYRLWQEGRTQELADITHIASHRSFFGRYWLALTTTAQQLNRAGLIWVQLGLRQNPLLRDESEQIHPDLAVIDLGQGDLHKIYIADHNTRSHQAFSEPENWTMLENVLEEFSEISVAHGITPIVVYIPSSSHIYAQYSTEASGGNWLAIRDREIAARKKTEETVARMVRSAGIDFITLSPVLERGAEEGKLLYFHLDQHWNFEGTRIAAAYVADMLKNEFHVVPGAVH